MAINETILGKDASGMPMPFYVRDEHHEFPNAPRVMLPEHSRVFGSIRMLAREKIAKVDAW